MASKSVKALQAMEKTIKDELEKYNATQKGGKFKILLNICKLKWCCIWGHRVWVDTQDLQKCITSKNKLDGQVIENKNVKDVSIASLPPHLNSLRCALYRSWTY